MTKKRVRKITNDRIPGTEEYKKRREWFKEYYRNNPEKYKKYRDNQPVEKRTKNALNSKLKKLERLAGRPCPEICEACHEPERVPSTGGKPKRLAFDHCHTTGEFRGWLCHSCNTALGMIEDSVEKLEMLKFYLLNSRAK